MAYAETEALLKSDEELSKSDSNDGHDGVDSITFKELTIDEAILTPGFGRFHYFMVMVMGWANSADTIEILSVSFILPYARCELNASGIEQGLLTAVGFAGMLIGALLWGTVADVRGRIKTLLMCQSVNAVFTLLSSLTQSFWFLVLTRFISGIGVGGTNVLVFIYTIELLPAKNRGRYTTILNICFMIGQVLIAGLAWLIIPRTEWSWTSTGFTFNSWRIFLLLSGIPVVSSVILMLWFPESPRFLVQMNRQQEARKSLCRIFRMNGYAGVYDDNFIIKPLSNQERITPPSGVKSGLIKMMRNYNNLIQRRDIRSRFAFSSAILFCLAFSYYGLTMWFPTLFDRMEQSEGQSVCNISPHQNKTYTDPCDHSHESTVYFDTFLQAVSGIPGNLFYFLLIDRIGRKLFIGSSMILTGVSVFFIWFVKTRTQSIVVSCLYAGITVLSWNAMSLVTSEIFPTELRSTARGLQSGIFNRIAAVLANVIFGAFVDSACTFPLLLICSLSVLGGILSYKLPNTTNVAIN